jgi:hypothetical protein
MIKLNNCWDAEMVLNNNFSLTHLKTWNEIK